METFLEGIHHFVLAFDVDSRGDIPERMGFECYVQDPLAGTEPWSGFLDLLQRHGLCLPCKQEGVQDFVGLTRCPDGAITPQAYRALVRTLNHVKLTLHPEGRLEAKAYLSVRKCVRSRRSAGSE
jgi:hypothetical protein